MEPLHNLILIKPCMADEVTEGGLFIPETARQRSSKAVIVEVSKNKKIKSKVGDTIIHIKGAGTEIMINGEMHYLMPEIDILSYVTNN
jgi:chaperonin GroES